MNIVKRLLKYTVITFGLLSVNNFVQAEDYTTSESNVRSDQEGNQEKSSSESSSESFDSENVNQKENQMSNNYSKSAVNNYILKNELKAASVTKAIWKGFPKANYAGGKPKGVVIHETANNNSTIYNEIAFMKRNYNLAFVHSFVDANNVINIADTNYLAWGAGYFANQKYVQFEQVRVHSKKAFAKEVNNAASYTASILRQYNLPCTNGSKGHGTVMSHAAVSKYLGGTNHTDPVGYYSSYGRKFFGQSYNMNNFFELVKYYYNQNGDGLQTNQSNVSSQSQKNKAKSSVVYSDPENNTSKLSSIYNKYGLYNHVPNSGYNTKKFNWNSVNVNEGTEVKIDKIGVKKSTKSVWYRVTFPNDSKKYWVYSKALDIDEINVNDYL
ncbi:N-acetylmuramoyl-L-alanine amidase [Lactobacillus sp. S2-2]|uniref:peptidoglycan recognition protein family protein n=1 Tax=Lactobacillus sp. S2-2 TaxID=2692917 RepID=UPI001F3928A0|nr:peptidoglycan recognition family protein [Lactobacillus sp. S2-2]MCF6515722.1 N-acetylmuramoyl-L-alanine amidase [Lactobacillus sp. S2-2]